MFNDMSEMASRAHDELLRTIEKLNVIVGGNVGENDSFAGASLLAGSGRETAQALSKLEEVTRRVARDPFKDASAREGKEGGLFGNVLDNGALASQAGDYSENAVTATLRRSCVCCASNVATQSDGDSLETARQGESVKEKEDVELEGREKLNEIEMSAAEKEAKNLAVHEAESRMYHRSTWNLRAKAISSGASAAVDMLEALYTAFGSSNKILFEAMKAAAITETVAQTALAVRGAYVAYKEVPPPAGPALAAAAAIAALAFGAARVLTIAKTRPGDAGATVDQSIEIASTRIAPSSAFPVAKRPTGANKAEPKGTIKVVMDKLGEAAWAEIIEDDLIPALNDAARERNVRISPMAFA
jgi:hypothetical protein